MNSLNYTTLDAETIMRFKCASQILYIKLSDVCKEFCKEDLYVQIDRLFYLKQYK